MNDRQIISGIGQGDESAINFAMDKYSKLVWHIVSVVLKNAAPVEDVEECTADVFVYLWQNSEKFDERRGTLKSWLSTVAKSKAVDKFRKLSKPKELELNDEIMVSDIDIADEIVAGETKQSLFAAINSLTETEREIILRRYFYNQKVSEISFALDYPKKQVENMIYRTKQKLRNTLIYQN